jgi:catalase-peroxidase
VREEKRGVYMSEESRCPVTGYMGSSRPDFTKGTTNEDRWTNSLDLTVLEHNSQLSNPMEKGFNYIEEFKKLNLEAVKKIFTFR